MHTLIAFLDLLVTHVCSGALVFFLGDNGGFPRSSRRNQATVLSSGSLRKADRENEKIAATETSTRSKKGEKMVTSSKRGSSGGWNEGREGER